MTGNQLQITVRHEEKTQHKDKEGYRSEFRYGTLSRTLKLPAVVDPGEVKASYTDGILEIRDAESPHRPDLARKPAPFVACLHRCGFPPRRDWRPRGP